MATPACRLGRSALSRRLTGTPATAGAAALAVALAAAGCGAAPAGQDRAHATSPSQAASRPTAAGPASPVRPASPASPSCPAAVYGRMTEAQRIGQLFLVGLATDQLDPATAATIRSDHFGSVLFGTTSYAGLTGTRAVANAVQSLASAQATAGVRFFVAANQRAGGFSSCGRRIRGHTQRAGSGTGRAQRAAAGGRRLGAAAAAGQRRPRSGPGDGRGAARHRPAERADRNATARIRP